MSKLKLREAIFLRTHGMSTDLSVFRVEYLATITD